MHGCHFQILYSTQEWMYVHHNINIIFKDRANKKIEIYSFTKMKSVHYCVNVCVEGFT